MLQVNDYVCHTDGIENIRVKMHDGMIRELTNLRYVQTFKKNLISPSVLNKNGYKIGLEGMEQVYLMAH